MHEAPRAFDKHDTRLPSVDLRNFPREAHFIANNIYISKKIPSCSHFLLRVWERFQSKAVTNSTRHLCKDENKVSSGEHLSELTENSSAELLQSLLSTADLLQSYHHLLGYTLLSVYVGSTTFHECLYTIIVHRFLASCCSKPQMAF